MVRRPYWIDRIKDLWHQRNIVWFSGVRRIGKTVLCGQIESSRYYNCDLPSTQRQLSDPEFFLSRQPRDGTIILDEVHRLDQLDPRVAFMEAPQMLLSNNAAIVERQFGLRLGEIAEGRPADLAVLDYHPPTPLDASNFLGHLIFGMVDATVDTTVCRGQILMQNKEILVLDEERIAARSRALAPQVWERL